MKIHQLNIILLFFLHACYSDSDPKPCISPGPLCETCSNLVVCVETPDGVFTKEPIETCTSPEVCVGAKCTNDTSNPFCSGLADLDFICRKVGIFPDPFYCNKFVLCVNTGSRLKPYLNECEKGFKYNVATSLCDILLENQVCPDGDFPIPLCTEIGQSGAVPGKPQEYYICEEYEERQEKFIYPVLNVCPGGEIYEDYQCVDNITTTTETTQTSSISITQAYKPK